MRASVQSATTSNFQSIEPSLRLTRVKARLEVSAAQPVAPGWSGRDREIGA